MAIVENLISEQNQYDLLYNILLSVKSKNPSVQIDNTRFVDRECTKLDTGSISISKTSDVKTDIASFSIRIEREEIPRIFSKNDYKYSIRIDGSSRGYSSFDRMSFNSELLSNRCKKVIGDIFDYLFNIDEQRKIEQTNSAVQNIISDISTTVDKAYKRDNKIDEVLNN
jgi:uncharacterized protein (UPF0332 family)